MAVVPAWAQPPAIPRNPALPQGPSGPPVAPPPPSPGGRQPLLSAPIVQDLRSGKTTMNYENLDLRVLARIISELTGRNIVVDEKVQGRITILSNSELTSAEAYDVFKAALERYGFQVVEHKGFTAVLPASDARRTGKIVVNPRYPSRNDDLAVGVIILQRGDAGAVVTALRGLVTDPNSLQAYQNGRAIIVADKASIVAKVSELAHQLDVATPSTRSEVITPRYAEAEKLAAVVQQVLTRNAQGGDPTQPPKISGFGPSNSIIVQGTRAQLVEARKVINDLDVPHAAPRESEKAQFYVYFLQYATADDTAKILSSVLTERQSQQSQQLQRNPNQINGSNPSSGSLTSAFSTSSTVGPGGSTSYPRLTAASDPQRISFVSSKVASDVQTNSLILFISPSEYKEVDALLKELDVPRKRVMVLAMVAETSLNYLLSTGAKVQLASPNGVLSTYNAGLTQEGLLSALAAGSFAIGSVGGTSQNITVQGQSESVPTFFSFLTGNKSNTDFNLISTPRVLTSDHKKAVLQVGNVVPFPTGAQLSALGNPVVTYDYKDVGIKLTLTPHISQSDMIRMELEQEVQEVTDYLTQSLGAVGYSIPLISNRSIKTTVTLKEGETLLIGGLISKQTVETISKVPILGDLPLINNFFKTVQKTDQKTTLFIALTPYIINSPDDVARLDRGYEQFLKGDRTPKDAEHEIQETGKIRHSVADPYQPQSIPGQPDPVLRAVKPLVKLRDLVIEPPVGSDDLRQPRVHMSNGSSVAAEFVLVETVKAPDGTSKQLKSQVYRLEAGQDEQVSLPPYRFPPQDGLYEFDLSAVNGDDVMARLPLPTRLEVRRR